VSLWLTPEELIELTGYKTSRCQKRALGEMSVPFKSRPADGYPLVLRADLQAPQHSAPREPRLRLDA